MQHKVVMKLGLTDAKVILLVLDLQTATVNSRMTFAFPFCIHPPYYPDSYIIS